MSSKSLFIDLVRTAIAHKKYILLPALLTLLALMLVIFFLAPYSAILPFIYPFL